MWRYHKTACYPKIYKVNASVNPHEGDNFWTHFFETEEEAKKEVTRRNSNETAGRHWNCEQSCT